MIGAPQLSFDDLFASTGIFGIELGAAAHAFADHPVTVRGYLTGPLIGDDAHFLLSRSPLPHCPFCSGHAHWPDDGIVVAFDAPERLPDIDDEREVAIAGRLETGERRHEDGFLSNARLAHAAIVAPVT